jgi:hypothetical protein
MAGAPTEDFMEISGLKITAVQPDYLLAMKLLSARIDSKDMGDIVFLMKKLDIKTREQAEAILTNYYPESMILPKSIYVIDECLPKE